MDWLKYKWMRARWIHIGVLLAGLAGCHCGLCGLGGDHGELPPPPPDPPGTSLHQYQIAQVNKAQESDFVIFLDEWTKGGSELGPHGHYHIGQIVRRLPNVPFPVIVQPQIDPALNELRRQVVVTALQRKGVVDADQRVIIAYPEAEGLSGDYAEIVYRRMLLSGSQNNQNGGYGSGLFGGGLFRGLGGFGGAGGYGGSYGGGYGGGYGGFGLGGLGGGSPWGY